MSILCRHSLDVVARTPSSSNTQHAQPAVGRKRTSAHGPTSDEADIRLVRPLRIHQVLLAACDFPRELELRTYTLPGFLLAVFSFCSVVVLGAMSAALLFCLCAGDINDGWIFRLGLIAVVAFPGVSCGCFIWLTGRWLLRCLGIRVRRSADIGSESGKAPRRNSFGPR